MQRKILVCPFCFRRGFHIRFDKRDRPYYACSYCAHKIFLRNADALGSVKLWCDSIENIKEEYMERAAAETRREVIESSADLVKGSFRADATLITVEESNPCP